MDVISTRQVADLLAVSEATVKRWADSGSLRCFRTPGGHRKFRMSDVAEFIRAHQYEAVGPLAATIGDSARGSAAGRANDAPAPPRAPAPDARATPRDPETAVTFRNLTLAGDVDGVVSLLAQLRLRGQTLVEIFDGVVCTALVDIGERWARGVLTVTQEHLAASTVVEALARTRPLIERPAVDRGAFVLACLGEEQHDLALRMAALLAYGAGYTPRFVGARTPAPDLALLLLAEKPRAVALAATEVSPPDALGRDLATVLEASHAARTAVVVGGAGFARLGPLPSGVRYARSLDDLAALLAA